MRFLRRHTTFALFCIGVVNGQTVESNSAISGTSGGTLQNATGAIVIDFSIGDPSSGKVSTVTAGGVQLKPGYVGQLYDIQTLPFTAVPDPVLEATTTQLTPGTATLDDGTTIQFEPSEILWSIVSGPITGIDEQGVATAAEVDQDSLATLAGSFWSYTATFELRIAAEGAELILSTNDAEGGTVTGGGFHSLGATVPITATPANGYRFVGWLGEGITDPDAASTTIEFTGGVTVTAHFERIAQEPVDFRILAVGRLPEGSIALGWSSVDGKSYQVESAIRLDAQEWIVHGTIEATGSMSSFTTGVRLEREEYFRIRLVE